MWEEPYKRPQVPGRCCGAYGDGSLCAVTASEKSDAERVEAALQHVERVAALVRHATTQGQLPPADAQKIIDAAAAFGAAVIF